MGHSWGPRDPLPGAQGKGRSHSAEVGSSPHVWVESCSQPSTASTQLRTGAASTGVVWTAPPLFGCFPSTNPFHLFIALWGGRCGTRAHPAPRLPLRSLYHSQAAGSKQNRRFEPKGSDSRSQSYLQYSSSQLGAVSPPGTFPSLACL